jgi:hypothetical protein
LNWLLVVAPVSGLGRVLALPAERVVPIEIVASRVVAAGLLLATVALAYGIARAGFGRPAARVVAVVLATSAGVIGFVHQLTADVPTMFWMVLAFHFAARLTRADRTADYVAAGLCTGIAAATKYNGLGVGIAIVVAHALRVWSAAPSRSWAAAGGAAVFHRCLWLGLAMVPAGFLLANPYALFDATTFLADVRYNAMVTPVYEGQHGTSYGAFVARLAELIGAPAIALGLVAAAWALVRVLRGCASAIGGATFWSTLAVVALYYATFGRLPRVETRFVLPIVPFVLLLAAPAVAAVRSRRALAGVVALVVAHTVLCAAWIGRRFLDDPRLAAAAWMRAHVPAANAVEADIYSPGEDVAPGAGLRVTTMPFVDGRERLFLEVFPGDAFVNGTPQQQRAAEGKVAWFSAAALAARAPDYVVVSSLYYDRFVTAGRRRELYPEMRAFFTALLAGDAGYRIVFDAETPPLPAFVYPRDVDFLANRATILQRDDAGGRARK